MAGFLCSFIFGLLLSLSASLSLCPLAASEEVHDIDARFSEHSFPSKPIFFVRLEVWIFIISGHQLMVFAERVFRNGFDCVALPAALS